ncbi:GNAT family N-acetyltransferase [Microbacterium sp. APC 3898]|uniref:GNAT family N-acetyltransferase n=1 Tax=Planococcus notacanthi TaxID=3035188 RepID=A0ABT7ZLX7_9BACL|nr:MULTISPECIES: GNAT family N-acetyltransferase [Terrabacteria group]MBF6633352.1 GNAT family N-acetyltransferase [Planococcus sp. (in: firmicutes)]MDN3428164.1 GNAT family N-acetyltransferase [Planococcus sp. APC 4016]MDN3498299.1 GNAT family N-acetyltransferase [Microbacterium sp. APC 3898]
MIQIMGMEEKHIRQMAVLLAKRHERERKIFSFLPTTFEEIDDTEEVLRHMLERPFINGIVAVRGIDVIGYMLYEFKEDAKHGRYVWMDYESIAISEHENPRLLRLLYADAGAEWIKHGYFHHRLMAPLGNEAVIDQWLDQSFSFEQKYGILSLDDFEPENGTLPKLEFRKGKREDASLLKKMGMWNSIHQAAAPSWQPITRETLEDVKESYEALSEDQDAYLWMAEQGDQIAGFHVYFRKEDPLSLVTPENCAVLPAASTNPDLRGTGVGRALANYCFDEMKKQGYEYIFADWHTPNQLASYFWPRMGFQPIMVRMVRKVDPRISWAHGE